MKTGFYYNDPVATNQLVSVRDVLDQVPAFNLMYELSENGSANNCLDENLRAQWRDAVRDGVILSYGKPIEVDFFRQIAGGVEKPVEATSLYIKSMQDVNMNVYAAADVVGGAPGAAATFTIARGDHEGNGKYSLPTAGGGLYNFYTGQMLYVVSVDTTVDYAHTVTVRPHKQNDTVVIKAGKPLLVSNARIIPGSTMTTPAGPVQWMSNGYIAKVQPFHVRDDWDVAMELDKAYKQVVQLMIIFDKNGNPAPAYDFIARQNSRWNLRDKMNQLFFVGQKVTNTDMLANAVDSKFPGFEGYDNVLKYGGGTLYGYSLPAGFSLRNDLSSIMLRQDARKRSAEYIGLDGFAFRLGMQNRGDIDFNQVSGSCTFETFTRGGMDKDMITKLGIKSYTYSNISIHFKGFDSLTDQRYLGHGDFPNTCYLMPSVNVRDTNGEEVPPVEFYRPKGWNYFETAIDMREVNKTDKWTGYCEDVFMATTHDPSNHIKIYPRPY